MPQSGAPCIPFACPRYLCRRSTPPASSSQCWVRAACSISRAVACVLLHACCCCMLLHAAATAKSLARTAASCLMHTTNDPFFHTSSAAECAHQSTPTHFHLFPNRCRRQQRLPILSRRPSRPPPARRHQHVRERHSTRGGGRAACVARRSAARPLRLSGPRACRSSPASPEPNMTTPVQAD